MKLQSLTATGSNSTKTVSDELFGIPLNKVLLAQAIRVYLANQRQGGAKTKRRGEVSMTTAKWFRQKGTGRARHGAQSAPQFVGGGVAHGPRGNQNWSLSLSQTMKRHALKVALSAQSGKTIVVDQIDELAGKTAEAVKLLTKAAPEAKRLLIIVQDDVKPEVLRSLRNVKNVMITRSSRATALEVALAQTVVVTTQSIKDLEARLVSKVTK